MKLTANGKSVTQPLRIALDPRVSTSEDGLVRQFALASRLSAKSGEASLARQEFGVLEKQLDERKKSASGNAELEKLFGDFENKLKWAAADERGEEFMQLGLSLPQVHPEPLPRVVSALGALIAYVESADAAPTADMNTASEAWLGSADETLQRWHAFLESDLSAINERLQKRDQKPLATKVAGTGSPTLE